MYNAIRFKFEGIDLEELSKKLNIKLSVLRNKINNESVTSTGLAYKIVYAINPNAKISDYFFKLSS